MTWASEADFQASVVELAERLGWRVFHDYDSRRNAAGFPDLVMVREGRLIFAELKMPKGRVSAEQQAWLEDLDPAGRFSCAEEYWEDHIRAVVWRPDDWDDIVEILSRGRAS